jgi:hypothetical protein
VPSHSMYLQTNTRASEPAHARTLTHACTQHTNTCCTLHPHRSRMTQCTQSTFLSQLASGPARPRDLGVSGHGLAVSGMFGRDRVRGFCGEIPVRDGTHLTSIAAPLLLAVFSWVSVSTPTSIPMLVSVLVIRTPICSKREQECGQVIREQPMCVHAMLRTCTHACRAWGVGSRSAPLALLVNDGSPRTMMFCLPAHALDVSSSGPATSVLITTWGC